LPAPPICPQRIRTDGAKERTGLPSEKLRGDFEVKVPTPGRTTPPGLDQDAISENGERNPAS
jgi:hypothetical protein